MPSLRTLLDHLASLTLNRIPLAGNPDRGVTVATHPTPTQQQVFELLGIDTARMFPVNVQVD